MKAFRACKLTFNGNQYRVNAQRVVARMGIDPELGYETMHFCDSNESTAVLAEVARIRHNRARRERDAIMRSCGLVKVRGALGGVYWE